jgi:hypothetical protein
MVVHIHVLKRSAEVRQVLCENGWDVEEEGADVLVATHPRVGDQLAARARLWRLGLLTSPQLRIDFEPGHLAARRNV